MQSNFEFQNELEFARRIMITCARITSSVQQEHIVHAQIKADRSPVTIADYAVQAFVAQALQKEFPQDGLLGEESSSSLPGDQSLIPSIAKQLKPYLGVVNPKDVAGWIDRGRGGSERRNWIIDPVDGTKGFLRRMQYVIALALMIDSEIVLSVIGCPQLNLYGHLGGMAFAALNEGSYWEPFSQPDKLYPLNVSRQTSISQARLLRSFEDAHTNPGQIECFKQAAHLQNQAILMDSQAKYVLLAKGDGEVLLRLPAEDRPDFVENIWDQAPAYRLIKEAGGEMTDRFGVALDFTTGTTLTKNSGIVATNGILHQETLHILKEISD